MSNSMFKKIDFFLFQLSFKNMTNTYKYNLIVKPCQSGKTQTIIDNIKKLNNDTIKHIILCDNYLLQVNQMKCRMSNNFGRYNVITLSGTNQYYNIDNLIKKRNIIVACNNIHQIKKIDNIIKNYKNYNYYFWIDEADKTMCKEKLDDFKKYSNHTNVKKISLITATPLKLINNDIYTIDKTIDNTFDRHNYQLFRNCDFKCVEYKRNQNNQLEYINSILTETVVDKGQVWFIPYKNYTTSHDTLKDYLMQNFDFGVFIINSHGKKFYYRNQEIDIEKVVDTKNKELSEILGDFYEKTNLKEKSVAITGYTCVSRGVTINSPKMIITHSILTNRHHTTLSNQYQLAGRICGNIKKFDSYIIPQVYCTEKMKINMKKMENLAKNLYYVSMLNNYLIEENEIKKSLENNEYIEIYDSVLTIQKYWLNSYYNPQYKVCKNRLLRQFEELNQELQNI